MWTRTKDIKKTYMHINRLNTLLCRAEFSGFVSNEKHINSIGEKSKPCLSVKTNQIPIILNLLKKFN